MARPLIRQAARSTRAPIALLAGALVLTFVTLEEATAQGAASGMESPPAAETESLGKAEESSPREV